MSSVLLTKYSRVTNLTLSEQQLSQLSIHHHPPLFNLEQKVTKVKLQQSIVVVAAAEAGAEVVGIEVTPVRMVVGEGPTPTPTLIPIQLRLLPETKAPDTRMSHPTSQSVRSIILGGKTRLSAVGR